MKNYLIVLGLISLMGISEVKADWPDYYDPQLLYNAEGTKPDGLKLTLKKTYAFHRLDVEKISLTKADLETCKTELVKAQEKINDVSFWDTTTGKTILVSLAATIGIATGAGFTILIYRIAK